MKGLADFLNKNFKPIVDEEVKRQHETLLAAIVGETNCCKETEDAFRRLGEQVAEAMGQVVAESIHDAAGRMIASQQQFNLASSMFPIQLSLSDVDRSYEEILDSSRINLLEDFWGPSLIANTILGLSCSLGEAEFVGRRDDHVRELQSSWAACWYDYPEELFLDNKSDERAKELLLSCLTSVQKEDFQNNKAFNVKGSKGNRYRIRLGKTYNVMLLGKTDRRFCAGPKGINLSVYDFMLAQKCILETNEDDFLKVANELK